MALAVVETSLRRNEGDAGVATGEEAIAKTSFNARDVLARDVAALDRVDELEAVDFLVCLLYTSPSPRD